jgi:hypothetical protein
MLAHHRITHANLSVRCHNSGGCVPARSALRTAIEHGIRGGALYDALIAATAAHHGHTLVSADRRAATVYAVFNVEVIYVGSAAAPGPCSSPRVGPISDRAVADRGHSDRLRAVSDLIDDPVCADSQ